MANRQHPRDDGIVDVAGHEHLRIQLQTYIEHTVPALHIDAYAQEIYQANKDPPPAFRYPYGWPFSQ